MPIITGSPNPDSLSGASTVSDDDIRGLGGNDTLDGGRGWGDDLLTGGTGADRFVLVNAGFGAGVGSTEITDFSVAQGDRLDVSALGISDIATLHAMRVGSPLSFIFELNEFAAGPHTVRLTGTAATDLTTATVILDTENLGQWFSGSGLSVTDHFMGLGNDTLWDDREIEYPGDTADRAVRAFGEGGDDVLLGSDQSDTLYGGGDNDYIIGYGGSDYMDGGSGHDTLRGGASTSTTDTLVGGDGNDSLDFGSQSGGGLVAGGNGSDTLVVYGGGDAGSSVSGGVGADRFVLNAVVDATANLTVIVDFAVGQAGEVIDLASLGMGDFATLLALGSDGSGGWELPYVRGGRQFTARLEGVVESQLTAGDFVLVTALDANSISGSTLADHLFGAGGDDILVGQEGDDTLFGEIGNDRLAGMAGTDLLFGGGGNDLLTDSGGDLTVDSLIGGEGNDTLNSDGRGTAFLVGGVGADRFVLNGARDTNYDVTQISDFGRLVAGEAIEAWRLGMLELATLKVLGENITGGWRFYIYTNGVYDQYTVLGVSEGLLQNAHFALPTLIQATNDVRGGGAAEDHLFGAAGNDILRGNGGNDTLFGESGNDNLYGGAGYDYLYGSSGEDYLEGNADGDALYGGDGNDTLVDSGGVPATSYDLLHGGAGDDRLVTDGRGTVVLTGGGGADVFVLGLARDTTYDFTTITDFQRTSAIEVVDVSALGMSELQTLLALGAGLPNDFVFYVYTNDVYDTFTLQNVEPGLLWAIDFVFSTVVANDTRAGSDGVDNLFGGLGDDSLDGAGSNDSVFGEGGLDTLSGGEGNDILRGGGGNDALDGGDDSDSLLGGDGNDTLNDTSGTPVLSYDTLDGGANEDRLVTDGSGTVVLTGGSGADVFVLGLSRDLSYDFTTITDFETARAIELLDIRALGISDFQTLLALGVGLPSDVVFYVYTDDVYDTFILQNVVPGTLASFDVLLSAVTANDTLVGGAGIDDLIGGLGNDRLEAAASSDRLFGEGGADTLLGGDGNDTLSGGLGRDSLVGGADADVFAFRAVGQSGIAVATRDVIVDFDPGEFDMIDLNPIDADAATAGVNDDFTFIGTAAFTAAGQVRVAVSGANTIVQVSTDVDTAAEMTILLLGRAPGDIQAGHFML